MDDAQARRSRRRTADVSACSSRPASAASRPSSASTRRCSSGGPRRISPFFIPGVHHQPGRRPGVDPVRRQGPELGDLHGLHGVGARHRRVVRDHPARRRRRHDCRRLRGGHHADGRRRVRRDARAVHAQRRARAASRPFDKDRDGFVIGEGSGMLVLEELESREARGAPIYAEIVGYGMTADAYHMTAPPEDADGAVPRACRWRSRKAGVRARAGRLHQRARHVHARSTTRPRRWRSRRRFGDHAYKLAMSSTKSMTGHLLGAAGGLEAGITALAHPRPGRAADHQPRRARSGVRPRLRAATRARPMKIDYALSNSFGFGGTNAALLLISSATSQSRSPGLSGEVECRTCAGPRHAGRRECTPRIIR